MKDIDFTAIGWAGIFLCILALMVIKFI